MSDPTDTAIPEAPAPDITAEGDSSFILTAIDVFNWGPFHGRHHCAIDPRGTAIIGPTGSGKTTLVDALMTLLAPYPKYNLASTGGHESDRDLISYVRGVSGVESSEVENSHVARPSKTLTGLSAGYSDGNLTLTLGCLLWVDGASNAADDLKKVWFFARDLTDLLDTLLALHHEGGKAALTRHARDTVGLRLFPSKKEYLAQIRGFFEVGGNAFSLLNRAAGLKQINSIDQIFRELVLDDRSAFERALEVAREFDTLQGIYEELQTARRQRDSLLPVRQGQIDWGKAVRKLAERRRLKELIPVWFAEAAVKLWQAEEERLAGDKEDVATRLEGAESRAEVSGERVQSLNEEYLRHGGAAIQGIEEAIKAKEQLLGQRKEDAKSYASFASQLGLSGATDEASFQRNRQHLPGIRSAAEAAQTAARQSAVDIAAELKDLRETHSQLGVEIQQVEARPNSNIPSNFQTFRDLLAQELGLPEAELPFVAEMVKVKAAENHWQGAIERAIGPERLRILVPSHRVEEALEWIRPRNNHLHVRLQSADPFPAQARFFEDGFTRKLEYRDHPLREHVKLLLSRRDRHCVASAEVLRRTEHAMTVEGLMSDREGRFEKQDQKPLSADWMTGFDNRHLLETLKARKKQVQGDLDGLESRNSDLLREETNAGHRLIVIGQFESLEFARVDVTGIEREIAQQRRRLDDLTQPNSDAAQAKALHDEAFKALKRIQDDISALREELGACKTNLANASKELVHAQTLRGDGLSEEDAALAGKEHPLAGIASAHQLADAERSAIQNIDARIRRAEEQAANVEKTLIRKMGEAKNVDTGHLLDAGTELQDLDAYLARLKTLEDEALPEKRDRFLNYLTESSGQGVTQLLSQIGNEVTMIQERVSDLNATLSRVDFRQGQFLQLHAQTIGHPALQQMETAQRKLRQIVLSQRDDEGEGHYRALGEVVRLLRDAAEKRHTLGAQAMLDPRHRLQFSVVEVDRGTGRTSGARKGSQTGSGGEKEMMASYILTASLSYALCPDGATRPRYASIVLDEAFSKSSPAAASRIIEALRAFGLHPLFVTPNKEIALLKAHTRSAILVHNKNKRATLTSLTWEEIESHARARKASDPSEPGSP
jgi:uncharacterized protein YPO0396